MQLFWIIVSIVIVIGLAWAVVGLTVGRRQDDDG